MKNVILSTYALHASDDRRDGSRCGSETVDATSRSDGEDPSLFYGESRHWIHRTIDETLHRTVTMRDVSKKTMLKVRFIEVMEEENVPAVVEIGGGAAFDGTSILLSDRRLAELSDRRLAELSPDHVV